ncbi:MAG: SdpI family protein [bacterium]|nr:SdpI family protein [bacterium]
MEEQQKIISKPLRDKFLGGAGKAKLFDLLSLLLVMVVILSAFYFHYQLPEYIINHWNAFGQADGYGKRDNFLIFISLFMVGFYLLFKYIPKIDPKKKNYVEFANVYNIFKLALFVFFTAMFFITIFVNMRLDYLLPVNRIVAWLSGLFFIVIGVLMKHIKQNWFMGIRTPWTLSNEIVWDKTHAFGGKVFVIAGMLLIIFSYLPARYFFYYMFVFAVLILLSTFGYSYWQYKKIGDKHI